uniref:Uncharacterized protein n=1 Tax=Populus trichocarpa TaxID=3694 RepID=A9PGV3_POPTR|nr:unknown [Populus trichocarpa]ABK95749.1 unknown [Populus trichocarpa]ABK96109.1 unknown [Populus trichocarpa]
MTGALAWQVTHHLNKTIIFVFLRGDRTVNCPGSPLCCPCPAFSYFSLTYDPCLRSRCPFTRHSNSSLAINSHLLHNVAICEADSKVFSLL